MLELIPMSSPYITSTGAPQSAISRYIYANGSIITIILLTTARPAPRLSLILALSASTVPERWQGKLQYLY